MITDTATIATSVPPIVQEQLSPWYAVGFMPYAKIQEVRESVNEENYASILRQVIMEQQGYSPYPFECGTNGFYSIGYGPLLKRGDRDIYEPLAVMMFEKALDMNLEAFIPIEIFAAPDAAEQLKSYTITQEQGSKLLDAILEYNRQLMLNKCNYFDELPENIRIAMHSLCWGSPALLGPKFMSGLNRWHESNDQRHLLTCLYEIELNSNPKSHSNYKSVYKLRLMQGMMFSNRALDFVWRFEDVGRAVDALKDDVHELYARIAEHYSSFASLVKSRHETIKDIILSGVIEDAAFPDLSYIQRKMNEYANSELAASF